MRYSLLAELSACLIAATLATACGADSHSSHSHSSDSNSGAHERPVQQVSVDPETTGAIALTVRLEGQVPAARQLDIGSEPSCDHGEPLFSEFVVANQEGQLANVLVRITSGHESWLPPAPDPAPVELEQLGCTYRPHVIAYQVGRELVISNRDKLLHNVHLLPKLNPSHNLVQSPGAPELRIEFHRGELAIPVQCDIHPWMGAWIHVLEHPWFSVTDEHGSALIENLPPGEYELELLHEKYGRRTLHCQVQSKAVTDVQYSLRP